MNDEPQSEKPGDEELVGSEVIVDCQSSWLEDTILNHSITTGSESMKELLLGSNHCVPLADNEKMQLSQQVATLSRSEDHSTYNAADKFAANQDLTPTISVEDGIVQSKPIQDSEPLEMETHVQINTEQGYNDIAFNSLINISQLDDVVDSEDSDANNLSHSNIKSTDLADLHFDHVKGENTPLEKAFPSDSRYIGYLKNGNQIVPTTSTNAPPEEEDYNSSADIISGSPICDVNTSSFIDLPAEKSSQLDRPIAETSDGQILPPPSPKGSQLDPDDVKELFPLSDANKKQHEVIPSDEPIVLRLNACLEIGPPDERSGSHENSSLIELNSVGREQDCQKEVADCTASRLESNISDDGYADRTRSGIRFSDDTNMLKDFLSRVQARKAVTSTAPPKELEALSTVRRSPRKVLGQLDDNKSTPPPVSKEPPRKSGSPLNQLAVDLLANNEKEAPEEPVSNRRSTRRRLPLPAKTLISAPSFIPVRRTNGADPVVLQKSTAHELMIVTRANTKRNQGKSKMPKLALRDPSFQSLEEVKLTRPSVVGGKVVSWDERLVHYQEAQEQKEGEDAQLPGVRRLRGLGAANGTPAPKRLAKDASMPRGRGAR